MEREGDENDQREQWRYLFRLRKEIRDLVDVFNIPDAVFRQSFRLSKPLVKLIVRQLTPYLKSDHESLAVPNTVKVLTALSFFASGSYQATVGSSWMICLGRSTVSTFISEVVLALNTAELQRKWIRFPHTQVERQRLCVKHQQSFKLPGVLGFVDGTEVTIACPPENMNPQSFWTRKHQYALNCMVMCDSNLIIRHIDAAFAGCLNDPYIFKHSALRRKLKEYFEADPSFWVLGDSIYALEPWMQIPILGAEEGSVEDFFTTWHCKARCCVERCIGVLKGRFRCLLRARALYYLPLKAGQIIKACALLHNVCRIAGVPDDDVEIVEGEEDAVVWVPDQIEAEAMEEEEDDPDPHFAINNDNNAREVGRRVQQRILDYLRIVRAEEAAQEEEE